MNYVPNGLHELNLIKERHNLVEKSSRKNLLISGGNTLYANNLFSMCVKSIIENPIKEVDIVFVDKNIMPGKIPSWMKKASFDKEMYNSLIACICRPGVGTLTEAIYYGVRIFTLFEKNNLEMINNNNALNKLNLGENIHSIHSLNKQICNFIRNRDRIQKQISNCDKIDFNGSIQISKVISKIIISNNSLKDLSS